MKFYADQRILVNLITCIRANTRDILLCATLLSKDLLYDLLLFFEHMAFDYKHDCTTLDCVEAESSPRFPSMFSYEK